MSFEPNGSKLIGLEPMNAFRTNRLPSGKLRFIDIHDLPIAVDGKTTMAHRLPHADTHRKYEGRETNRWRGHASEQLAR
jgi:hypothetical protein